MVPIVVAAAKLRGRTSNLADVTSCAEPALIEIQSEVPLTKQMILILDGLDELVGTLTGGEKVAGQVLATVFRHIPVTARVIAACRELVFSSIEQAFTSALPESAETPSGSNDVYDLAIGRALADRQPLRVMRVQPVLRRDAEDFLAHKNLSGNLIHAAAMNASLEPLLRHPFTVRLLTLSLPKLASRGGDIALSEVYRAYVTAALLREDRTLRPADLDGSTRVVWLRWIPVRGKHERFANLAARAGLLVLTGTTWRSRHYSLWEYFFAVAVRRQLQQYDSKMLSQLDLVNGYNINRMLVPMLTGVDSQREVRGPARVVTSEEYEQFLENTGWRRASGYGIHPSTSNAPDGIRRRHSRLTSNSWHPSTLAALTDVPSRALYRGMTPPSSPCMRACASQRAISSSRFRLRANTCSGELTGMTNEARMYACWIRRPAQSSGSIGTSAFPRRHSP